MKSARLITVLSLASLLSCAQSGGGSGGGGSGGVTNALSTVPNVTYNKDTTVCDPLHVVDAPPTDYTMGLKGKLFYLTDDMPRYTRISQVSQSIDSGVDLFLTDLNVPTRYFTRGFPNAYGDILQANGRDLVEWFGIQVDSTLHLTADDPEGSYEIATIADDGSILTSGTDVIVNNDGTHSSKLACGSTLNMTHSTALPMRMTYYQGPATEIALIMMWRKVDPNHLVAEPLCEAVGQNLFFEYMNNPSTPQQAYLDLLSRGWTPVPTRNFRVPASGGGVNPCTTNQFWSNN